MTLSVIESSEIGLIDLMNDFEPDKPTLAGKNGDPERDRGIGVIEAPVKPKLKEPPMYKVILLNDDYTPMEFVVEVLQIFFGMNREKATQVMLAVHTTGRATCGIFTRDVAETKSAQVNQYAQDNQHPLVSDIEAVQ